MRKRERIQGPRGGDWVIMPDKSMVRLSSGGITKHSSWIPVGDKMPIDGVRESSDRVLHPVLTTDTYFKSTKRSGSFMLNRDGTTGHFGGNTFRNVSRRAKLVDTVNTKPASFHVFEMGHPDLSSEERFRATGHYGVSFELPCRVYRLIKEATDQPDRAIPTFSSPKALVPN